jgi:hypothetical protein
VGQPNQVTGENVILSPDYVGVGAVVAAPGHEWPRLGVDIA